MNMTYSGLKANNVVTAGVIYNENFKNSPLLIAAVSLEYVYVLIEALLKPVSW